MPRLPLLATASLAAAVLLGGCDMLGIESATAIAAQKEAEGKAIGGACRHAGRAIEDCFVLNRKADKAAVFAGWREMNDYMRENKIDAVAPQLTAPTEVAHAPAPEASAPAEEAVPAKPAKAGKSGKPGKAERVDKADVSEPAAGGSTHAS